MAKWKALGILALSVSIGMLAPVQAQQKSATSQKSATKLAAQDYLDIQQLVNRYSYALDLPGDNGFELADLFTADGELVNGEETVRGREALARFARRSKKPDFGVSQFLMNHIVEPSADGATGKQYNIVVNIGGPSGGAEFSNTGGHYEDVYVKTPQGWKFKRREFIQIKSAPRPGRGAAQTQTPAPAPAR
jgi:hypothetical protein